MRRPSFARRSSTRRFQAPPDSYSHSRARDDAARTALVPLREGERPRAVTAGALAAAVLGLGTVAAHVAALATGGQRQPLAGVIAQSLLMLVIAWGMWGVRYWAVLAMQVVLGVLVVLFSLLAVRAESLPALGLGLAIIAAAGTLFWFLVKAMARIQMPTPPGGTDGPQDADPEGRPPRSVV